jgi:hypothetical protein
MTYIDQRIVRNIYSKDIIASEVPRHQEPERNINGKQEEFNNLKNQSNELQAARVHRQPLSGNTEKL